MGIHVQIDCDTDHVMVSTDDHLLAPAKSMIITCNLYLQWQPNPLNLSCTRKLTSIHLLVCPGVFGGCYILPSPPPPINYVAFVCHLCFID